MPQAKFYTFDQLGHSTIQANKLQTKERIRQKIKVRQTKGLSKGKNRSKD